MTSLLLSRSSDDVRDQLPRVDESVLSCPMSRRQNFLYSEYLAHRFSVTYLLAASVLFVCYYELYFSFGDNNYDIFVNFVTVNVWKIIVDGTKTLMCTYLTHDVDSDKAHIFLLVTFNTS